MSVNLLSGLAQGFAQAHGEKLKEQQNEEIKKLQVKLFKQQLESQDQQKKAADQFLGFLNPSAAGSESGPQDLAQTQQPQDFGSSPNGLGGLQAEQARPVSQPRKWKNLMEALSSPEGQSLAIQGGLVKATDLQNQGILDMLTGGGKTPGMDGMVMSGVKLDPRGRPMLDFSKPTAKAFVPHPSGKGILPIDQYGRPMATVQSGASEQSLTPGQKKVDTDFAQVVVDFEASGGFADVQKQLDQLRQASEMLGRKGANLTGPWVGSLPDWALSRVNPEAITVKEMIQESAQRNLRLILGPQFTEKEGERLLARVFNPALGEAENKRRADRLIQQIQLAAQSKQEAINYFKENGTLQGFKGKVWTAADFDPDGGKQKPTLRINKPQGSETPPPGVDPKDWEYMSPEEKKLWKK